MSEADTRKAALVLRDVKGSLRFDLDNPKQIEELLGRDLLIAFAKCFVGLDRVVSLRQLYLLNEQNAGVGNGYAKDRNAWMVMVLLIGTMHEFGKAVDAVQAVLGRSNRRNLPSWDRMMEVRRSWVSEKIGKDVRDQLAHHLGDSEFYEKGLDEIRLRPSFPLYSADGPTKGEGHFEGAWNLLMLGLGIDLADYLHIFEQTITDVAEIDQVMLSVFLEVLKDAGIPVEDRRSR